MAAAPAPEHASLTLRMSLPTSSIALRTAVAYDDRGTVLVVVEDRDLHSLAQCALDIEALRRLDVLEVDAAEGRLQARDDLHELVWIALVDLDIEHVNIGKFLEQAALRLP